jgi:deazaflavin-dependent oxidoreductase (nitroreductase family)
MRNRLFRLGNTMMVGLYRRTGGRVGGKAKAGSPVLLLTVPGRKSGQPHTIPATYVHHDGAYYLAAAGGGQPREPQWMRNLRAAPRASVQVGSTVIPVAVEVLEGAERDAAWSDVILATFPFFADYEKKTSGRRIAVARLTPVVDAAAG